MRARQQIQATKLNLLTRHRLNIEYLVKKQPLTFTDEAFLGFRFGGAVQCSLAPDDDDNDGVTDADNNSWDDEQQEGQ